MKEYFKPNFTVVYVETENVLSASGFDRTLNDTYSADDKADYMSFGN